MHQPFSRVPSKYLYAATAVVGLIILIYGAYGYTGVRAQIREARELEEEYESLLERQTLEKARQELAELREYTASLEAGLKNENAALAARLSREQLLRSQSESAHASEAAAAAARLALLEESDRTERESTRQSRISEWRTRVAQLTCDFGYAKTRGSGVLMRVDAIAAAGNAVLTNQHVIATEDSVGARSCTVSLPDGRSQVVTNNGTEIEISRSGFDFGFVRTPSFSTTEVRVCRERAPIGSDILILGYPSIGSQEDITVTEGIVSGYEGDYYITSAKVERGNSGGAAIDVLRNCYLGIPTYVATGQIESLARILDARSIGI